MLPTSPASIPESFFFFSSRRRHTRLVGDWSDVCSSDLLTSGSGGRPILPDVARLAGTSIVCLYGRDEADESLCPLLRDRGARVVELGGGHHFGGDYGAVAREVARALADAAP